MPRRDDQDEPGRVFAEPLPKESPEPTEISPRDRVPERILTQILGVSHRQDARGNEGLIYAPVPLGMEEERLATIRHALCQLDSVHPTA